MLDFMQHIPMHMPSKMQSVRFEAPSLQFQRCTAQDGHVNVRRDREVHKKVGLKGIFPNIFRPMQLKDVTVEERVERMAC
jgi:hypothetical protein